MKIPPMNGSAIIIEPPDCPYCDKQSTLVNGETIYPHRKDLYKLYFYRCRTCDAYVGVHKET